jgi:hypothetical protein
MGLEDAEAAAMQLYEDALALLGEWDANAGELRSLLARMVKRDR